MDIVINTLIVVAVLVGIYVAVNLFVMLVVGAFMVVDEVRYPQQKYVPERVLAGSVINKPHNGISGGSYTRRDS